MTSNPMVCRRLFVASLFGLMVCTAPAARAADRLTVGQYEYTMTADGKPAQTYSRCLTPDDAKSVNADAKTGRELIEQTAKGACTIKNYDITGNTVAYSMSCDRTVRTIRATYTGDAFESDTTTTIEGQNHLVHIVAKRVGICKAK
jgi:hypothetical protein